jgi:hypothetical protein
MSTKYGFYLFEIDNCMDGILLHALLCEKREASGLPSRASLAPTQRLRREGPPLSEPKLSRSSA